MSESQTPPGAPVQQSNAPKKGSAGCWTALAIVVALVIIGKSGEAKKARDVANAGQAGGKSLARVDIATLLDHYKHNEVGADGHFKNRIVEFSGVVDDVGKDILGDVYVTLGTGKSFEVPQAQCFFGDAHVKVVAQLGRGSRITVRGRVEGLMFNVLVKDCVVVK